VGVERPGSAAWPGRFSFSRSPTATSFDELRRATLAPRLSQNYHRLGELVFNERKREMVMPFAAGLRDSLRLRDSQVPSEISNGDCLEHVLDRHLLAVEEMAEGDMLTSILLLSSDGKRLGHAAAPNLPPSYCEAIDDSEIGPRAGSCGTAAFLGCPIYVTDIATDPLWEDYRHIALPHGLRACWSTPIRDPKGSVIGTFAIYHRRAGSPTCDEIDSIAVITEHVSQAIVMARTVQDLERVPSGHGRAAPELRLVPRNDPAAAAASHWSVRLLRNVEKLTAKADDLDRCADESKSDDAARSLRGAADDCRRLVASIMIEIEEHDRRTSKD
jgi:hypothetical protein